MKYEVKITETLERIIEVDASNQLEALDFVDHMYQKEQIVLNADDFVEKSINVISPEEEVKAMNRHFGKVKWFNDKKGYGFIVVDGLDEDVFVHFSNINMDGHKTLHENDLVGFGLIKTNKGYQAVDVQIVK